MKLFNNRVLLFLLGVVTLLFVVSGVAAARVLPETFTDVYARFTGEKSEDSIDKPIEVTHGTTTLSLSHATVTGSQTVVELILVDPILPKDAELIYQFSSVIPSKDIILEDFESKEVLLIRESRRVPGQLALTLELPMPANREIR